MIQNDERRVSIITPVYNGDAHLAECIRSVLAQTYSNFDYWIVNNCSTDQSLSIAEEFAEQDSRIRIHNNTEFLSVVENHNNAFSVVPEESEYCKIVGADDWLFPQCVSEMVRVADAHPTIGMVSSYVLVGTRVGFDGLPYPSTFTRGKDICRMRLLDRIMAFGGPSSSLLRNSVVRAQQPFYKLGNYHGDNEAYLDLLQAHDFGFVHQVLSYIRRGEDSQTTHFLDRVDSNIAADVEELVRYGPVYLSSAELEVSLNKATKAYYKFLAHAVVRRRDEEFWNYHREKMEKLGTPIDEAKLRRHVALHLTDLALNPKRGVEAVYRRIFAR